MHVRGEMTFEEEHSENVTMLEEPHWDTVMALSQKQPVIVDFWADWCAMCANSGDGFSEIADKYKDAKVKFVKFDIKKNQEIPKALGFKTLPIRIMFFKGEQMGPILFGNYALKDKLEEMVKIALK